ncbi:MAG TPA: hypothetical protein VG167_16145 [Verrucomicrobiae bacterium]|nr:hypothetical protein [Verrucomicrobiae bacterium]
MDGLVPDGAGSADGGDGHGVGVAACVLMEDGYAWSTNLFMGDFWSSRVRKVTRP